MKDPQDLRQQLFDQAAKAIIAQGKPAMNESGSTCMYRSPDGSRCAIGHLIEDDEWDKTMEGYGVITMILDGKCPPRLLRAGHGFLDSLQMCHDRTARDKGSKPEIFMPEFKAAMRKLAKTWKLDSKEVV